MEYENRLVAFIDILGFKEIIKNSEQDFDSVKFIFEILEYLKTFERGNSWDIGFLEIEECVQYKGKNNFDFRSQVRATAFSDSIVVSIPFDNNINEATSFLITNLSYIGAILIEKGILLRGAITYGKLIHNDNGTVLGQGLIEAYQLESSGAVYPRIILSKKLIDKLNYPIYTRKGEYPYHNYLKRFGDGFVGFTQLIWFQVLQSSTDLSAQVLKDKLDVIRKYIVTSLDDVFENNNIYQKYIWLKNEYNSLCILDDENITSGDKFVIKKEIIELNKSLKEGNIHYHYTDDFYNKE